MASVISPFIHINDTNDSRNSMARIYAEYIYT